VGVRVAPIQHQESRLTTLRVICKAHVLTSETSNENRLVPFLKWPGGKRWLVRSRRDLFPEKFERYIEPFLGGGSVFFALNPGRAILSDINAELIGCYKVVAQHWRKILQKLSVLQHLHCADHYYQVRSERPGSSIDRAVRFIYLNRTCFNGLYRENRQGEFNVPIGTKSSVILPTDDFESVSKRLKSVDIMTGDFAKTLSAATDGDFVFIDPPYTVAHNQNGFVKYNDLIFSWEDQIRLRDVVVEAKARGVKMLVLNADHASIRNLYNKVGHTYTLSRNSKLAADPNARQLTTEVAVLIN
jgi:DNA adenine methylase